MNNTDLPVTRPYAEWPQYAAWMTRDLSGVGLLAEQHWRDAFRTVPRHRLLPGATDSTALTARQLAETYTDPTIEDPSLSPASPATPTARVAPPSVLAWVLGQMPHRNDGDPIRVLQLGAGAGYLTGLLCHGLGDRHVVATERDPGQRAGTRRTLAELGWFPEILDGPPGAATYRHGPYDVVLDVEPHPRAAAGTRARALERGICWAQLAPAGRMIHDIPELARPGGHRLAVIGHRGEDRPSCVLVDPQDAIRTARSAIGLLTDEPGLRAELLADHVADAHGRCRGCARAEFVQLAPCTVHTIAASAETAAAQTCGGHT